MKARDVIDMLEAQSSWVDWSHTRDMVLAGDPEREVQRVGVTWVATMACLREARERNVDLLISHENPLYAPTTQPYRIAYTARQRKLRLIQDAGLVVYRCHDVWDKIPAVGVADQWARVLGLSCTREVSSYIQHATVEDTTVHDLARRCAAALASYGEDAVWVIGDLDARVRTIGLGTGAATDIFRMLAEPCDVCIVADDGITNFHDVQFALDVGVPLIIVNHACCEKPGIDAMVTWLGQRCRGAGVEVVRLDEGYTMHAVVAA